MILTRFKCVGAGAGKDKHGLPILSSLLLLSQSSLSSRDSLAADDLIASPVRVALVAMKGFFE